MSKLSTLKPGSDSMERLNMILFYCSLLSILIINSTSAATNTIFPNQTLKDGHRDTIVSEGEIFELGFFSFENSSFRYLGIWYKKISPRTVVWVANRERPLPDASAMLKLNDEGNLQLLTLSNTSVWSSQSSKLATNNNPVAQLLDSGNLVIRDAVSGDLIWESFDHPGDTWLPGMKLGGDRVTGKNWNFTSWKTSNDPSFGSYTVWMNINGYPQLYIMEHESSFLQRIGYWNGLGFSGMVGLRPSSFYTFDTVLEDKENYIRFTLRNSSALTRMILRPEGNFDMFLWADSRRQWVLSLSAAIDQCDMYGICGPYGVCRINNAPPCACLEGFQPKLPDEWSVGDWSNGCQNICASNVSCTAFATRQKRPNFKTFSNLKLPDSQKSWFNKSVSLEECQNICASNVSCTAFANTDIREGKRGCITWSSELMDMRETYEEDVSGQDIYIKMDNREEDVSGQDTY